MAVLVGVLVGVIAAASREGAALPSAPATGMLTAATFAVGVALLALVTDQPAVTRTGADRR